MAPQAIREETTYRWACDRGVILTMDPTAHVIHGCGASQVVKASLAWQTAPSSPAVPAQRFASVLLLLCFHCRKHSPRALAIIHKSVSRHHRIS